IICQRMQISDHVGALAVLWNAGKAHRGAWDKALRIGDELVEVLVGPGAALGLHGGREIDPAILAFMVSDDPVKIRTDAVGAALLEGVAGGALFFPGSHLLAGMGVAKTLPTLR